MHVNFDELRVNRERERAREIRTTRYMKKFAYIIFKLLWVMLD
jgi:hypothetical protein